MNEIYNKKEISSYYEENEIPYHYIWYYIDEKTKKKVPIGEYNKAIKKTVEQKLYKQNMEGMKMTVNQENKLKNLNENEKNSIVISYTSFLKHTTHIYCIDIDEEGIKSALELPEEFGKIRLSGYIKGNTKGIHIYIKILNMVEYENQQDVIKLLKGDLIRENNIWEKVDKKYNYNGEYEKIMEFEWNDIKYLFDEYKMNIKKKDNDETTIILSNIKNKTIYEKKTLNLFSNSEIKDNDLCSIVSDISECTMNILEGRVDVDKENTLFNNINKNKIDWEKFKEMVYGLKKERSDDYNEWKLVIWGIANVSRDNKWTSKTRNEIIHNFSKKSEKYDEYKVDYFIDNNIRDDKDGINVASIIDWYRKDNNINIVKKNNIIIDYSERGMGKLFIELKDDIMLYQDDILYIYYKNEWIIDKKGDICKYIIGETLIDYLINEKKDIDEYINKLLKYEKTERIEKELKEIEKKREEIILFIKKLKIIKFIGEILKQIQTFLAANKKKIIFDLGIEQKFNIHFKNGVYDLKKKEFRKRIYSDYITQYLEYDYIEKDEIDNNIHLFVDNFFKKIQPNKEERDFTLGYLAYCLTGDTGKQIFKINIGYTASNGKSTEVTIHDMVFPIYTKKLCKDIFNKGNSKFHKFANDCLNNPIRLGYIEELNQSLMDVDIIKDWVDGKKLTIEILYGTNETKAIQAKLMTFSNKDINIEGDEGLYRRGRLQFYNSKFDDFIEDDCLNHKYKKIENIELIFNDIKYKNAYFHLLLKYIDDLKIPKTSKDNFKNLVDEHDNLKNDIIENFIITQNINDKISKSYIEERLDGYKWAQILTKLKSMGIIYDKDKRVNGEKGILLGLIKNINNDSLMKILVNDIINDIILI